MADDTTLPNSLCSACVSEAITTASFIHNCQKSLNKWTEITQQILQNVKTKHKQKNLFLIVENNKIQTFFDKSTFVKTPKNVLKAIKTRVDRTTSGKRRWNKILLLKENKIHSGIHCPYCEQQFASHCFLNLHLMHTNITSCLVCHEIVQVKDMESHLAKHNKKVLTCKLCSEIFEDPVKLDTHTKKWHRGRFRCLDCNLSFPTQKSYTPHIKMHEPRVCNGCAKKFNSRKCFKYHKKVCKSYRKPQDLFICDYCHKEFDFRNTLAIHIKLNHLLGRLHQCEMCGKKFSSSAHLDEHTNTHEKVPDRFVCEFCPLKYSTKRGYNKHIAKHFETSADLKKFKELKKSGFS